MLVSRRRLHERTAASSPVVRRPRIVGNIPIDAVIILELIVTKNINTLPEGVPSKIEIAEDRSTEFRGTEDTLHFRPIVTTADVEVDDVGARREPDVIHIELWREYAERGVHERISFLFDEIHA